MARIKVRVPGGGIRWWLTRRFVPAGAPVEAGGVICLIEMTTGAFTSDAEADAELEAPATGIIQWDDIPEGSVVEQGQVIGWIVNPRSD
jgi:pyruvate/2-oxoglutarate dehydrogenase complex dihydrolipoamide acyltransferase (E2) component